MQQKLKELCNWELPGWWMFLCCPGGARLSQGLLLAGMGNRWDCAEVVAQTLPEGAWADAGDAASLLPGFVNKQHEFLSVTYFTLHVCGALMVAGNLALSLAGS